MLATHDDQFRFVQDLAGDLSRGKVELPSFPDVVIQVRRALAAKECSPETLTRIVSAEPALAARLLEVANSAALNRSGRKVTELRTAITRAGQNMVRNTAMAFALTQIRKAHRLRAIEHYLAPLWQRGTNAAAIAYVLARRSSAVNADEALLAGMLHNIGKLYMYSRLDQYPMLFSSEELVAELVEQWHPGIGRAVLENWELAEPICHAVNDQNDLARHHDGPPDLTDLLAVALLLARMFEGETIAVEIGEVRAIARLGVDSAALVTIMRESQQEIAALSRALGR